MVETEQPTITRLQFHIDAHDEQIQNLTKEMKNLTATVSSLKAVIEDLPGSIEQMLANIITGKRAEGSGTGNQIALQSKEIEAPPSLFADHAGEQAIDIFLWNLKNDVRNWIRASIPSSGEHVKEFASHVSIATPPSSEWMNAIREETDAGGISASSTTIWGGNLKPYPSYQPGTYTKPIAQPSPSIIRAQCPTINSPTRHLTKSEWGERQLRVLRFGCGLDYTPQHKRTAGQLRFLLLGDGEDEINGGKICTMKIVGHNENPTEGECQSLEICRVIADSSPSEFKTLKLMEKINDNSALILMDSGTTCNSISKNLASALGLDLTAIGPVGIRLGDGNRIWATDQGRNIPLKLSSLDLLLQNYSSLFTGQYLELVDRINKEKGKRDGKRDEDTVVGNVFNKPFRLWLIAWEQTRIAKMPTQISVSKLEDKLCLQDGGIDRNYANKGNKLLVSS